MITGYNDTFQRTVSGGLGTATSGQVYTVSGTASQYSVAPGTASILPTAVGERYGYVDRLTSDIDITGQVALSGIPATNLQTVGFIVKRADSQNYYNATMMVAAGGGVQLRVSRLLANSLSTLTSVSTGITYVANTFYNLRVQAFWSDALQSNVIRSKLWAVGATEPGGWGVQVYDAGLTQYTAGTGVGVFTRDEATTPGTITAKIQNVAAKTYGLPVPAGTDLICYAPASSTNLCSIGAADGTFETTTGTWTPTNSTYARQSAVVHSGAWAGSLTAVGSPSQMYVRPAQVAVTAGQNYTATMWVRSATAFGNVGAAIDWFDSGANYITSSSTSIALTANTWMQVSITAAAPAGAAFGTYGPTVVSPTAGQVLYLDDVDFQTYCASPAPPNPKTTALQALAQAADAVMVGLDPRIALASSYPRVRVSRSNWTLPSSFYTVTYDATEFNVGTATDLSYASQYVAISYGIWLVTFEIELVPAARDTLEISIYGGTLVTVGPSVYMRSELGVINDEGWGGTGRIAAIMFATDPVLTVNCYAVILANATYTVKYSALSAIKISDYF